MVNTELTPAEKTAREAHYYSYRSQQYAESGRKKSTWYRLLFPLDADFEVKENPYAKYPKEQLYDKRNGHYFRTTNRMRDHYQE